MSEIPSIADVFIVGGGPAGLAAAIAARRQGLTVILADGAKSNIDKACGEGLMPQALKTLAGLGITIGPEDGHPFRGIQFVEAGYSAAAEFSDGVGLGVRRTRLHTMLAEAAEECGATLLWRSPVTSFGSSSVVCGGRTIHYKYLIGADGHSSEVRKNFGLGATRHESSRFGFRRHYNAAPWSDCVEVHWGNRCQIYITPVGRNEIGVAVLSDDSHLRLDQALQQFPQLQQRLLHSNLTSSERGAVSASRRLRRVATESVALIGDASGSVDAITGDGLSQAFQQAEALAAAMSANDLASYQTAHNQIRRRPALLAQILLSLGRNELLRRLSFRFLAEYPSVFTQILSLHTTGTLNTTYLSPLRQTQ